MKTGEVQLTLRYIFDTAVKVANNWLPRRIRIRSQTDFEMKMNIDNKARLAFVLVLLLGAATAFAWYLHASSRYTIYEIYTHDPTSGLIVDAPIEYHGVELGKVQSVNLVDPRSIRILLSINKSAPVTAATVATVTTRGLSPRGFTGYVYISLEDTGSDFRTLVAPPGEPYPVIPTAQSKSFSLDVSINQVNENVQRLTELLQDVLDRKTIASFKQSMDNLQRVTKTLANNNDRLNSLLINGERASRELQPLLESSQDVITTLQTQILPEAHKSLTSLDNLSNSLTGFATEARPLLQSGKDTVNVLQTQILPEAHRALKSLENLSNSLNGFAAKVSKDPSVIIRGPALPRPGPGE